MKSEKGLKYYASILIFSSIALILYLAFLRIKNGELEFEIVKSLSIVPIFFTALLFVFDQLLDKIFPKKKGKRNVKFDSFLKTTTKAMQDQCDFSIEEYARLRSDQKFQKGLGQAFRIYDKGENEDLNIEFLERKFKKGTKDYEAFQVVIKVVKEMMEIS